jgi:5'-deoxynucleotidase YfbR-like HD superfamily hydrolase
MVIIYAAGGKAEEKDMEQIMAACLELAGENAELRKHMACILKERSAAETYAVKTIDKLEDHLRRARRQRDIEKEKAAKLETLLAESLRM